MRAIALAALALVPTLVLCACASDDAVTHPAAVAGDRTGRLQRDCEARGGVLVPSGRLTGEAPLDNVCRIHDPATLPAE